MRNFLIRVFSVITFIAFLFGVIAFASDHLREDTTTLSGVYDHFIICDQDLTAHYITNRYVTFSFNNHSTSYIITSSAYEQLSEPDCLGGTVVRTTPTVAPAQTGNLTVRLWQNNPIDTTPPTQSNITAGSITQTAATITWTTNESATHTIKYGTTSGSYDSYPNTKAAGSGTSASGAP